MGVDPASSDIRRSLTTANGLILAPEVRIEEFHSLGQAVRPFPVLAHTIPLGSQVSGVLGMNFLRRFPITLDFRQGVIES